MGTLNSAVNTADITWGHGDCSKQDYGARYADDPRSILSDAAPVIKKASSTVRKDGNTSAYSVSRRRNGKMPERSLDYRISRCLAHLLVLFSVASVILIVDAGSLPVKGRHYDYEQLQSDPVFWRAVNKTNAYKQYEEPARFWEFNLGNHFVSNIENVVMMVCFLWGWMRLADLIRLFMDKEKQDQWTDFWFLCEDFK